MLNIFQNESKPTPIEVPVDGVPNWEPYNPNDEFYMDIDTSWQIKQDFTEVQYIIVSLACLLFNHKIEHVFLSKRRNPTVGCCPNCGNTCRARSELAIA